MDRATSQHRPRTRSADPRENDAHQRHEGPVVQPGYRMRRLAESQWVYTRKICAYLALISSAERSTSTASSRISLISLKGLRSLRSLTSACTERKPPTSTLSCRASTVNDQLWKSRAAFGFGGFFMIAAGPVISGVPSVA